VIHPATDPPPLSREGAIAVVVAEHPAPVGRALWVRLLLMVLGSAVIAGGVATLLWTGLGPGPLDVFITAVVDRWGIPITFVVWGVALFVMSITTLLGHRPGLGTLALPLISGALLPFCMSTLDRFTAPEGLTVLGIGFHLLAILVVGIGAGAVIAAGLGAGMGELIAIAAADRSGRPEPLARTAIEATWLVVGWSLGGTVGLGTVMVTLLIGPSVRNGHSLVRRLMAGPTPTSTPPAVAVPAATP
jgi:uncharacterized membrane protein YczE